MRVAPFPLGNKAALRKELRRARRALERADHRARSNRAARIVATLSSFKSRARIAIYLPFDREVDPTALIAAARRRGVQLFVPVITDLRHRVMKFHPLSERTRAGTFGISVPHRTGIAVAPRWLDLIVVPLVGIDGEGRRMGMGGGFYDRALQFRRVRRAWRGPRLVGLAFECQCVASVFADPWDARLDGVATEGGLRRFKGAHA